MAKDLLTREELSLLLADDTGSDERATLPTSSAGPFSPEDFGNLQKVLATYLIPGVTAWSVLFGRSVELADPEISLVSAAVLGEMDRAVVGEVDFLQGMKGHARFVLPLAGARVLVGLALGSPEPPEEFDLIHRSSFASVLKYLLAEMRSLISRGTGRRVGTTEPVIKLWPEEVLPESGHLVQAKIPWWVDGVQHPGLLFWADLELTRGLLGLVTQKPKPQMSPGESAWMGASLKSPKPADRPLGGGRVGVELAAKPANRLTGSRAPATPPPAPQAAAPRKTADDLSIWTLGRARGQNPPPAPGTKDTRTPEDVAGDPPPMPTPAARGNAALAPRPAPVPPPEPEPPPPPPPPPPRGRPAPMAIDPTPPSEAEDQEVRVELGRATIRDPLTLGQILPLDRLAGESVDIFVDGQLVARGEVTVDGEVLAVRVTQTVPIRRKGA